MPKNHENPREIGNCAEPEVSVLLLTGEQRKIAMCITSPQSILRYFTNVASEVNLIVYINSALQKFYPQVLSTYFSECFTEFWHSKILERINTPGSRITGLYL